MKNPGRVHGCQVQILPLQGASREVVWGQVCHLPQLPTPWGNLPDQAGRHPGLCGHELIFICANWTPQFQQSSSNRQAVFLSFFSVGTRQSSLMSPFALQSYCMVFIWAPRSLPLPLFHLSNRFDHCSQSSLGTFDFFMSAFTNK